MLKKYINKLPASITHLHEDFPYHNVIIVLEYRAENHCHSVLLGINVPTKRQKETLNVPTTTNQVNTEHLPTCTRRKKETLNVPTTTNLVNPEHIVILQMPNFTRVL